MAANFVPAALRGSTYGTKYAWPFRLLRPRGTAILNILQVGCSRYHTVEPMVSKSLKDSFFTNC